MQDCAAQIVEGIRILAHILQPREVLIGIEDNKPQAISMLRAVLADAHDISLRVIPTKYPSGGAKQLTQILTGKQVPHGGRSSDIGVLMQNVGTAYAVKRAVIDGEPITERVVTLTGEAVSRQVTSGRGSALPFVICLTMPGSALPLTRWSSWAAR